MNTQAWSKYTYICYPDNCDALVEVTATKEPYYTWCPSCGEPLHLISKEENVGVVL